MPGIVALCSQEVLAGRSPSTRVRPSPSRPPRVLARYGLCTGSRSREAFRSETGVQERLPDRDGRCGRPGEQPTHRTGRRKVLTGALQAWSPDVARAAFSRMHGSESSGPCPRRSRKRTTGLPRPSSFAPGPGRSRWPSGFPVSRSRWREKKTTVSLSRCRRVRAAFSAGPAFRAVPGPCCASAHPGTRCLRDPPVRGQEIHVTKPAPGHEKRGDVKSVKRTEYAVRRELSRQFADGDG